MKNTLLLTLLILFKFTAFTQTNLVPNPSFETKLSCTQHGYSDWWETLGSSDYFNRYCTTNSDFTLPSNLTVGYQEPPFWHEGAYIGLICSGISNNGIDSNYREIVQCQLKSNLIIGQKYYCSFYMVRADSVVNYQIDESNNIGLLFTNKIYSNNNINTNSPLVNRANVYTSSSISDSVNWTHITGSFIADSAYSYLLLGCLFDDLHIQHRNNNSLPFGKVGNYAYYLFDDICVSTDSLYAENYQWSPANDIEEINSFESLSIYPNPSQDFIHCEAPIESQISIYNSLGVLTLQFKSTTAHEDIDISNFPDGVYFVKASKEQKNLTQKFIKMNSN